MVLEQLVHNDNAADYALVFHSLEDMKVSIDYFEDVSQYRYESQ